jgi:N-acetylmuramoyl-L-alanine amidase
VEPTIQAGDDGPEVRDVQGRLARLRRYEGPIDERFDSQTEEAVRAFQRERGLAADGIVGPETWRALVEAGHQLGDRLLWQSPQMLRGDDVRELQHRLNQLGFDAGPEDGIFGPLAHAAVAEFQRNVGLDVDGVAGPRTIAPLKRLRRDHQSGGVGARAREREWLRSVAAYGFSGVRLLVDPAQGPDDPGATGPASSREHEVTWTLARRLAARLSAQGAEALLSRGPARTPTSSERATFANEQGVVAVVCLATGRHHTPTASGASAYYFGAPQFTSEAGHRLAHVLLDACVTAGAWPDGRMHPMTWTILRETRMPAVVVEPGFLTNPDDERWLTDPEGQEALTRHLAEALVAFFDRRAVA